MKDLHKIISMAIISAILIIVAANVAYNYGYNKGQNTQEIVYETVCVQDTVDVEDKIMKLLITYSEYADAAESIIQLYYEHDSEYYLNTIRETLEYKDYINTCDKLNEYN